MEITLMRITAHFRTVAKRFVNFNYKSIFEYIIYVCSFYCYYLQRKFTRNLPFTYMYNVYEDFIKKFYLQFSETYYTDNFIFLKINLHFIQEEKVSENYSLFQSFYSV